MRCFRIYADLLVFVQILSIFLHLERKRKTVSHRCVPISKVYIKIFLLSGRKKYNRGAFWSQRARNFAQCLETLLKKEDRRSNEDSVYSRHFSREKIIHPRRHRLIAVPGKRNFFANFQRLEGNRVKSRTREPRTEARKEKKRRN